MTPLATKNDQSAFKAGWSFREIVYEDGTLGGFFHDDFPGWRIYGGSGQAWYIYMPNKSLGFWPPHFKTMWEACKYVRDHA